MPYKDADGLAQGIFGKAFAGRYRVLARDMQTSYAVVFDEVADAKRILAENRACLGIVVGPDGAGLTLYVRPPHGAQERHKVDLMATLWMGVHACLAAHAQRTAASRHLRFTGRGECLWIQDAPTMGGALVLGDVLHKSKPKKRQRVRVEEVGRRCGRHGEGGEDVGGGLAGAPRPGGLTVSLPRSAGQGVGGPTVCAFARSLHMELGARLQGDREAAGRRRAKWRQMEARATGHGAVCLQETRSMNGDLVTMPSTHTHMRGGTFMAFSDADGRRVLALFLGSDLVALEHGRAHLVRSRPADCEPGPLLFNLHLEPASRLDEKRRLLDRVWRRTVAGENCTPFHRRRPQLRAQRRWPGELTAQRLGAAAGCGRSPL